MLTLITLTLVNIKHILNSNIDKYKYLQLWHCIFFKKNLGMSWKSYNGIYKITIMSKKHARKIFIHYFYIIKNAKNVNAKTFFRFYFVKSKFVFLYMQCLNIPQRFFWSTFVHAKNNLAFFNTLFHYLFFFCIKEKKKGEKKKKRG